MSTDKDYKQVVEELKEFTEYQQTMRVPTSNSHIRFIEEEEEAERVAEAARQAEEANKKGKKTK